MTTDPHTRPSRIDAYERLVGDLEAKLRSDQAAVAGLISAGQPELSIAARIVVASTESKLAAARKELSRLREPEA